MATFIVLAEFTDQGIRNVKETIKRAEAFKLSAKKMGVTINEIYWTMGQFDIVTLAEAPDEESMTALLLSAATLGNVRTHTLRAFSAEQMGQILEKLA